MLDEKPWLAVSALIHAKGVISGWCQDSVQASQVLHTKLAHPCLYGPCFVMLEQEEAIPKLFSQLLCGLPLCG